MTLHQALELFDVPKDATSEAVKKMYHKLARNFHPDLGGSSEKMQQLNDAYKLLYEYFKSKEATRMYKKESHEISSRSFFITKDPQNFKI